MANQLELIIKAKDEASAAIKDTSKALDDMGKHSEEAGSRLAKVGDIAGGILKAGAVVAGAGLGVLVAGIGASIKEAMDAQEAVSKLDAVIKSTGGAAGVTSEAAQQLASSLQDVTTYSDEAVMGAEAVLLRFKTIGKEVFPEATKLTLDLATAMGTDAASAATMLGKALVEPGDGLLRLKAAGIAFSDSQIELIKNLNETGHTAEAQKMILDELAKSIGGAAEAAGSTFSGKLEILQHKFSDILEIIGGAFLPALTELASALVDVLNRPEVIAGIQALAQGFSDAMHSVGALAQAVSTLDLGSLLQKAMGAGQGGAESGGMGGIVSGLQQNFQKFADWLGTDFAPAFSSAMQQVAEIAGPTLQRIGEWLNQNLMPVLQRFGDLVGVGLQEEFRELGTIITKVLLPGMVQLATWIFKDGLPALGDLASTLGGKVNEATSAFSQLWQNIANFIGTAYSNIKSFMDTALELAAALQSTIGSAFQWFIDNILTPLQQALQSILGSIQAILDGLSKIPGVGGGGGGGTSPNPSGGTGGNFASGGMFVVPPGFPNDTYSARLNLTSGERVSIQTPAQQRRGDFGGGSGPIYISIDGSPWALARNAKIRSYAAHGV